METRHMLSDQEENQHQYTRVQHVINKSVPLLATGWELCKGLADLKKVSWKSCHVCIEVLQKQEMHGEPICCRGCWASWTEDLRKQFQMPGGIHFIRSWAPCWLCSASVSPCDQLVQLVSLQGCLILRYTLKNPSAIALVVFACRCKALGALGTLSYSITMKFSSIAIQTLAFTRQSSQCPRVFSYIPQSWVNSWPPQ